MFVSLSELECVEGMGRDEIAVEVDKTEECVIRAAEDYAFYRRGLSDHRSGHTETDAAVGYYVLNLLRPFVES